VGGNEEERGRQIENEELRMMNEKLGTERFYPEETLVEKVQSGVFGWLGYVTHHSKAWKQEYERYCRLRELPMNDGTAEKFLQMKQEELEEAIANGDTCIFLHRFLIARSCSKRCKSQCNPERRYRNIRRSSCYRLW
jgi:hypothetical protein